MNCKNCGNENSGNTKFCVECGTLLSEETVEVAETATEEVTTEEVAIEEVAAEEASPAEEMVTEEATPTEEVVEMEEIIEEYVEEPKKKGGKKVALVIGIVVVVLAVAAAIGAKFLVSSPEVTVAKAFANTGDAIVLELDEMAEAMPIAGLLADFATGQYTVDMSYDSPQFGLDIDTTMDNTTGQMKVTPSVMGFSGDILISEEYITLEMDLLSDVYGVNLETLEEDLVALGYMEEMPEGLVVTSQEEVIAEYEAAAEAGKDIVTGLLLDIAALCSVEELGTEDLEIGGYAVTTDAYGVLLDVDGLGDVLETLFDEILANEVLVTCINRQIVTTLMADGVDLDALGISGLTDTSLLEEVFAEILVEYEAISGELAEVELVVNVYNDKVARMSMSNNDEVLAVEFGVGEKILERVAFLSGYVGGEVYETSYSMVLVDDVLESNLILGGETIYTLSYDIPSAKDNFVLNVDGEEMILSVDATEEMAEIIWELDAETLVIEIEKTELAEGWFAQETSFINALELTEADLQAIAMQILFSGMF